jgi:serine/threonine-protein kinase
MVTLPPGSTLGRYRIIQQLGRGGMATVFKAFDPVLDRHVAVKVLLNFDAPDPTFAARFAHEAQTVAKLNHPNILQVYDFGEDKGFSFIVSELVTGGTIQDKLKSKAMSLDDALKYIVPLAEALDYAHGQGIIHRDLKPANVLLDPQERPVLADFGLARMLQSMSRFTQAQQALGTPEYMAPEQAMGADADHRSDLYAFGIMVFQMLLGETPYHADTPAATLMAHVHSPLPLPSALDPNFDPKVEACMLKSLAKDPNDRYQSAREFVQALSLASGRAVQMSGGPGGADSSATVVVTGSQLGVTQASDIRTAVLQPGKPSQAGASAGKAPAVPAPGAPAQEAPAPPAKKGPPILLIAGGAVAVIAVVVVVMVVLALGGGEEGAAATVVPTETGQATTIAEPTAQAVAAVEEPTVSPSELLKDYQEMVSNVKSAIPELREIGTEGIQKPQFRTREDLATITRGIFRRPQLRDQIFQTQELYKALGLMADEEDLEEILTNIHVQQVSALFDDSTGSVYVVSDAQRLSPRKELAFAAAYAGALIQGQFNFARVREDALADNLDRTRAVDALNRGDVFQLMQAYIGTQFDQDEINELSRPLAENELVKSPDIVQKANRFLNNDGGDFVAALYGATGSWLSVDEAYAKPPLSTEQILHPDKYLTDEAPQKAPNLPDLGAGMGQGWTTIGSDTMGEFLIRSYLEQHLDDAQAAVAAAGWGGDTYTLASGPEGQVAFLAQIVWDTSTDVGEFFEAYKVFAGIKAQEAGGTSRPGGRAGHRVALGAFGRIHLPRQER